MKRLILLITATLAFTACKDESKPPPALTGYGTDDGDTAAPVCGDGILQESNHELCDGTEGDKIGHACSEYGWGSGTVACGTDCVWSGCSDAPAFDDWGDGAGGVDETGEPPECESDMMNYSCNGIAYGVYKDTASNDLIMEVFDNSIGSGRTLACVGDMIGTPAAQNHIVTLDACSANSAGVEEMIRQQCATECGISLTEGSPFREDFAASGRMWTFQEARCAFGTDLGSGVDPIDPSLINSISWAAALGGQGCNFEAGVEDFPGTSTGDGCGTWTCAEIECTEYEPAVHVWHDTDRTVVRSGADADFAEQLKDNLMLPFCHAGMYAWDSDTPTRAHFEGLGAGELYYELGFRTGDRLLSIQEYIPPSSGDPDSSDLVGPVYPLTTQFDLLDAVDALELTEEGEHFFLIKFKRGTSSNWQNWVRVVEIID